MSREPSLRGFAGRFIALGCLCCVVAGCRGNGNSPRSAAGTVPRYDPGLVNGQRALAEVENFVRIRPRDSGTEGARKAAEYLAMRLESLDIEPVIDAFTDKTPKGDVEFRNVWGVIPGKSDELVILASHYDTKAGIAEDFVGANDSGSSTGLLLELARILRESSRPGPEIVIVFFDGEECMQEYDEDDGLHGSRYLAKSLIENLRFSRVRAMILLDMIGDKDLNVTIPRNSTPKLVSMAFAAAKAEGARRKFGLYDSKWGILDDHVPFLRGGMPAIDLIDFEFGSKPGANDYWHTSEDTLDKLSAESLELVGRVIVRMLNQL